MNGKLLFLHLFLKSQHDYCKLVISRRDTTELDIFFESEDVQEICIKELKINPNTELNLMRLNPKACMKRINKLRKGYEASIRR